MVTGKKLLVIIEDNTDQLNLLKIYLALSLSHLYEIEGYNDAREALPRIPHAHCVVTDINMPKLDGHNLVAALAEQGLAVHLIVMTAYQASEQRAAFPSAHEIIQKPFSVQHLTNL